MNVFFAVPAVVVRSQVPFQITKEEQWAVEEDPMRPGTIRTKIPKTAETERPVFGVNGFRCGVFQVAVAIVSVKTFESEGSPL